MTSFILSLKVDAMSFEGLQAWRPRHFPPALNYLPAHLTLLHNASSEQISRLREHWPDFESHAPPRLTFAAPQNLSRGVAIEVEAPDLRSLRSRMIEVMAGDLYASRSAAFPRARHGAIQDRHCGGESAL